MCLLGCLARLQSKLGASEYLRRLGVDASCLFSSLTWSPKCLSCTWQVAGRGRSGTLCFLLAAQGRRDPPGSGCMFETRTAFWAGVGASEPCVPGPTGSDSANGNTLDAWSSLVLSLFSSGGA